MNAWQAIGTMLKAQGVKLVFGIGDTDLSLWAEKAGIKPINLRYEGSAPFMAMAYTRLSGKPGVCTASPGPGTANMVPGVLEAYSGCVPLLVLCPAPSQKTIGKGDFQECDQLGIMKPITKWSAHVTHTKRIPWYINRAFSIAMNGQPGPVYLEFPYDVGGIYDFGNFVEIGEPKYITAKKIRTAADPELINEASMLIQEAKRPIIVAGNGAIHSKASEEFKEFIELLGIPFMTTPGGRGILSENHPLALGLCGLYRNTLSRQMFSDSDLIITIGSRNESFQTHQWTDFPEKAKFIQIDISAFEIGRNWVPDVGVVGDAKIVLQQLTQTLKGKRKEKDFKEIARVKELVNNKKDFEAKVEAECKTEETPIASKRVVYELTQVFGRDTILVNENGGQDTWSYFYPYFKVQEGGGCVPVAEQTCMGMGVVGAIGAKLTMPKKNVVCVTGDGAFQMYMKELPTAVQYNVGCTWIVLNNSAFGWVKSLQADATGWDTATFKAQPDFVKWAEACNCYGKRIEKDSEIKPALEEALKINKNNKPAVLEFITGFDLSHFEMSGGDVNLGEED